MRSVQHLDGFNLDRQARIDQQIISERPIEPLPLKFDVNRLLAFDRVSHLHELARQHGLVDALQQSWAKLAMDAQSEVNHVRLVNEPNWIARAQQWRSRASAISVRRMRRSALILSLASLAGTATARGPVLYAGGAWAAIDRGAVCEALARSQKVVPRDKVQPIAGISFTADRKRWGEFHARLSRTPRADASVMLRVGERPFLLVTRGGWAWSRGPAQAQAIIEALRAATNMSIVSRDAGGVRFSDPYLLDGAPTAIDAAAARCAVVGAGKIE